MNIDTLIKKMSKDLDEKILQPLSGLEPYEVIPFDIASLDDITGIGGVPRGGITELYGAESSGKSALALSLIASAQRRGLTCVYIDVEMAMTQGLAVKMGVDTSKIILARPLTGESAFDLVDKFSNEGVDLIVLDSVSSLLAESEKEADYDQQTVGLQARLVSKALRKLVPVISRTKTALVLINQLRDKVGAMPFAEQTTTSGGHALKHYALFRFQVSRIKQIKEGTVETGFVVKVFTRKNKTSTPHIQTEINFFFETGFDKDTDLLNFLIKNNVITSLTGRTFYHGEVEIGNKEKSLEYIKKNYDYKTRQLRSEPSSDTK